MEGLDSLLNCLWLFCEAVIMVLISVDLRSHILSRRRSLAVSMGNGCFPAKQGSLGWAYCNVYQPDLPRGALHSRRVCSWRRFPIVASYLLRLYQLMLEQTRLATPPAVGDTQLLPWDGIDDFDVPLHPTDNLTPPEAPCSLTVPVGPEEPCSLKEEPLTLSMARSRSRSRSRQAL